MKDVSTTSEDKKGRSSQAFASLAVKYMLRVHGQRQAEFALETGLHESTVSQLLGGSRRWKLDYIDSAAAVWGLDSGELLNLGRDLYDTGRAYPYQDTIRGTEPHTLARLTALFRSACGSNIPLKAMVSAEVLRSKQPAIVDRYLRGEIDDAPMFEGLKALVLGLEVDPELPWSASLWGLAE